MNIQTSVFKLLKCLLNTFDTINKTIFLSKKNSFSDETKKKKSHKLNGCQILFVWIEVKGQTKSQYMTL